MSVKKLSIDWEALKTFSIYVKNGTFSGSAKTLGLTHATISRRIRILEEQFDSPLFIRRNDEIELTPLGQTVLETADSMTEQSSLLERKVAGSDMRVEGTVRIASTESMGSLFLSCRLPFLLRKWPGLDIELVTNDRSVSLARRDADIAIRFARPDTGELIAKRLGSMPYYLCGTKNVADSLLSAPETVSYITYDDGVPEIPETRWRDAVESKADVRFRTNSLVSQYSAAKAGVGIALLPHYLIDADLVITDTAPVLHREIWMVFHRDLKNVRRLRITMEWLESCFFEYATER